MKRFFRRKRYKKQDDFSAKNIEGEQNIIDTANSLSGVNRVAYNRDIFHVTSSRNTNDTYQYAIREYGRAIHPSLSNDDGMLSNRIHDSQSQTILKQNFNDGIFTEKILKRSNIVDKTYIEECGSGREFGMRRRNQHSSVEIRGKSENNDISNNGTIPPIHDGTPDILSDSRTTESGFYQGIESKNDEMVPFSPTWKSSLSVDVPLSTFSDKELGTKSANNSIGNDILGMNIQSLPQTISQLNIGLSFDDKDYIVPSLSSTSTFCRNDTPQFSSLNNIPSDDNILQSSSCIENRSRDIQVNTSIYSNEKQSKGHLPVQEIRDSENISEPEMPDATYSEYYGDAYVDAPTRYVYPSGYTSLRPRSGPWRLSILFCLSFSFLTVFIVGHCSDRVDLQEYNIRVDEIDDDAILIETRWCGSRTLYFMWVLTVLITSLLTSYCSIIGYIKARDFSVANGRSQPPGMMDKTDYYVRIEDAKFITSHKITEFGADISAGKSSESYQHNRSGSNIYQADGTPQFWGGHIYHPSQAAVAVTSR